MQTMESIGERIRRLREQQGITRKDLARRAGMSYSGLSDLELGNAKSTTKLHRVARELGVDANYLETGKGTITTIAEPAAAYQAQAVRLDPEMLRDVAQALHEVYEEQGLTYRIEDDPELFIEMYLDRLAMHDMRSMASVVKIARWMERRTPQGSGRNERVAQVPAKGTPERKAGGRGTKS